MRSVMRTKLSDVRKVAAAVIVGTLVPLLGMAPDAVAQPGPRRGGTSRYPTAADFVVGSGPAAGAGRAVRVPDLDLYVAVVGNAAEPVTQRIKACQMIASAGPAAAAAGAVPVLAQVIERAERIPVKARSATDPLTGRELPATTLDRGVILRMGATYAMARIGPEAAAEALPSLVKALHGIEGDERGVVAHSELHVNLVNLLGQFGPEARGAAPVLRGIVGGEVRFDGEEHLDAERRDPVRTRNAPALRCAAATALGRIAAPDDEATLTALRRARSQLEHDAKVREAARAAHEAIVSRGTQAQVDGR